MGFRLKLGSWFNLSIGANTYEAGSTGRRLQTWGLNSQGPNSTIFTSYRNVQYRSRELYRNNPWAIHGVDTFVSNLIGRGLTPRWKTDDPGLNKDLSALWNESVAEMDFHGLLPFYGLQSQAATSFMISGEILGQLVYLGPGSSQLVPIQLKLFESDHLDATMEETAANGNSIRMGIEFDNSQRRVAYHLYKDHPGEMYLTTDFDKIRVPASDILHIMEPARPGQLRGVPRLAPIIARLKQLDEYEDGELFRKKVASFFACFVLSPPGEPGGSGIPGEEEIDDTDTTKEYAHLEPGITQYLSPGEDVKFAEPADVGGNYDIFMIMNLRAVAAGMGVTYEQLTGDLTKVNFSSIRTGLNEFRRRCRMMQQNIFVHQFCRPFALAWQDMAVLSRAIKIPRYWMNRRKYIKIVWDVDGWEYINPPEDIQAERDSVRAGFKSRSQVIGERGRDVVEVEDEIQEENKRADQKKLILDTDPRKTNVKGGSPETGSQNNSKGGNKSEN